MNNATWLKQYSELSDDQWFYGWTTAEGPNLTSDARKAEHVASVEIIAQEVGLPNLSWVHQVHGGDVIRATDTGCCGSADALWSNRQGLAVVGRSADCPIILLGGYCQDQTPIWGFAHASWRSTILSITGKLVDVMTAAGASVSTLKALICPSAGQCCYEVGPEVKSAALTNLGPQAGDYFLMRAGKLYLDLWQANKNQMTSRGVLPDNIHNSGICTICSPLEYPSYRRQGTRAGRFVGVIGYSI